MRKACPGLSEIDRTKLPDRLAAPSSPTVTPLPAMTLTEIGAEQRTVKSLEFSV